MERKIADIVSDIKAKVAGAQGELVNGRLVTADRLLTQVNADIAAAEQILANEKKEG